MSHAVGSHVQLVGLKLPEDVDPPTGVVEESQAGSCKVRWNTNEVEWWPARALELIEHVVEDVASFVEHKPGDEHADDQSAH